MCVLVTQSYPTLCNSMDSRPPGSSDHGILQARIWEWVAIPFSRGSSGPRDKTRVSSAHGILLARILEWVASYDTTWIDFLCSDRSSLTGTATASQHIPLGCEADDSSWCQIIEVFSTMKTQPLHLQGNTKSFRWHRFAVKSLIFGHRRL